MSIVNYIRYIVDSSSIVFGCMFYCFVFTVQASQAAGLKDKHNAVYSGAVVHKTNWLIYSSYVRSLWAGIHEQGWQVRVMSGKGRYTYTHNGVDYQGDKTVTEAMIGYQLVSRPFFLKLYAGPLMEIHLIEPMDSDISVVGRQIGGKVVFESWVDIGTDKNFVSLDASFSTLDSNYLLNAKIGMQPFSKMQIGLETEFTRDIYADRQSAGLFATYRFSDRNVVGITVGATQDGLSEKGLYGKLKYDVKF